MGVYSTYSLFQKEMNIDTMFGGSLFSLADTPDLLFLLADMAGAAKPGVTVKLFWK